MEGLTAGFAGVAPDLSRQNPFWLIDRISAPELGSLNGRALSMSRLPIPESTAVIGVAAVGAAWSVQYYGIHSCSACAAAA